MSDATSWSTWGKPIVAAVVTSLIAYFQITMFTLTASYAMNRSIYRSTSLRVLTGVFAGLTAMVTFWVVLFLPKVHYFGFFPSLGPLAEDSQKRWGFLNYFRSSYDATNPEHMGIVEGLVRSSLGWRKEMRGDGETWVNSSGVKPVEYLASGGAPNPAFVVNEAREQAARDAGAIADPAGWGAAITRL